MKTKLLTAVAALALVGAAPAAHALVWTTQLDYGPQGQVSSMGTVTVTELDANDVQLKVHLNTGYFVDTGGHELFTFNLIDTPNSTVSVDATSTFHALDNSSFTLGFPTAFSDDPTNHNDFSNQGFGYWDNAVTVSPNGGSNLYTGDLILDISNVHGITFAGTNPNYNHSTGQLISTGCTAGSQYCNTFDSNDQNTVGGAGPGGWWFAVDTSGSDPAGGEACNPTCVIAGRDAFTTVGVPEPAAWALMILGFGGIGAMMRRHRAIAVA